MTTLGTAPGTFRRDMTLHTGGAHKSHLLLPVLAEAGS